MLTAMNEFEYEETPKEYWKEGYEGGLAIGLKKALGTYFDNFISTNIQTGRYSGVHIVFTIKVSNG